MSKVTITVSVGALTYKYESVANIKNTEFFKSFPASELRNISESALDMLGDVHVAASSSQDRCNAFLHPIETR